MKTFLRRLRRLEEYRTVREQEQGPRSLEHFVHNEHIAKCLNFMSNTYSSGVTPPS